jgi:hypothetical protein
VESALNCHQKFLRVCGAPFALVAPPTWSLSNAWQLLRCSSALQCTGARSATATEQAAGVVQSWWWFQLVVAVAVSERTAVHRRKVGNYYRARASAIHVVFSESCCW